MFAVCAKNHWGSVPPSFDERKHFCHCPTCDVPMKLMRGFDDPVKELHFRDKDRVIVEIRRQS